jgi:hypothetical protein
MVTDIIGGGVFGLKPGEITDDTEMTLMVAEGILENSENPINAIGDKFIKWADNLPKDIGIICCEAIDNFRICKDWMLASKMAHQNMNGLSAGNGTDEQFAPGQELHTHQKSADHHIYGNLCPLYDTGAVPGWQSTLLRSEWLVQQHDYG